MKKYLIAVAALCCFSVSADELIHTYTFQTDLSDEVGDIDLVATGGAVAGGRYFFSPGEGLTLTDGLPDTSQYSIELYMQFSSLEPVFKKLIDFQNLTADAGLYMTGSNTIFYQAGSAGPDSIEVREDFRVVLTRTSEGLISVYLNGQLQTESVTNLGVPADNILQFLLDDGDESGPQEAGFGSVDYIRVYDAPLSAEQVSSLLPPYQAGELLHTYTFDNGFEDSTGSVNLFNVGGELLDGRYVFDLGEGLTLVDGLPNTSSYSIEMQMRFDSFDTFWKKVIDFNNLMTDTGLYIGGTETIFYIPGEDLDFGVTPVTAGQDVHIVITRTEDDLIRVVLNGILQSEKQTSEGVSADNVINFFLDDIATSSTEQAPGSVDYIRVFFGALSPAEISRLVPPAPAQPVVVRDLFHDDDGLITYDSSTNLEWLDISETVGLSINEIQNLATPWVSAGFTVATKAQVTQFVQSLGVRDIGFSTVLNAAGVSNSLNLVGCTWSCTGTAFQRSSGIALNDNLTSGTILNLDYLLTPTPDLGFASFIGSTSLDSTFIDAGVYLVREAEFSDSDGDTVLDNEDNCSVVANQNQRDTDGDGFGNICDPDLNNDGNVNFIDVSAWIEFFGSTENDDTDFNGDGVTNLLDFAILASFIFGTPGPGAVAP